MNEKKGLLSRVVFGYFPAFVQDEIFKDISFCNDYDLLTETIVSLENQNISFRRSEFYNEIRRALTDLTDIKITSIQDKEYLLHIEQYATNKYQFFLSSEKIQILLPDYSLLTNDLELRIQIYKRLCAEVNFQSDYEKVITKKQISDAEFDNVNKDLSNTPIRIEKKINDEIRSGYLLVDTMVPGNLVYYERLIGPINGSATVTEFAKQISINFLPGLMNWNNFSGLIQSLYLSSHPSITAEIDFSHIDDRSFGKVLQFIIEKGDLISQLGVLELCLCEVDNRPDLENTIENLIDRLFFEIEPIELKKFNDLSRLFVLVDGVLSAKQVFRNFPPFYRKLAAFSQSAIIMQQFNVLNQDPEFFLKNTYADYGYQFYFQSLVDLRINPLWDPEFINVEQMKQDFIGRLINHADIINKKNKLPEKINTKILGEHEHCVKSLINSIVPFFPGPLDDSVMQEMPAEINEKVIEQISLTKLTPKSLIAVINYSNMFVIDEAVLQKIVDVINNSKYIINDISDPQEVIIIIEGLSKIAAIHRFTELVDLMIIMIKNYSKKGKKYLPIDSVFRCIMFCAASYTEFDDWAKFIGKRMEELSFSDLSLEEAGKLYNALSYLLVIEPELWYFCGKAEAALGSLLY